MEPESLWLCLLKAKYKVSSTDSQSIVWDFYKGKGV